jgi:hypothetical protein
MLDTLTAYSQIINTATSILMVLIWLVYLQSSSYSCARDARSISTGARPATRARCIS